MIAFGKETRVCLCLQFVPGSHLVLVGAASTLWDAGMTLSTTSTGVVVTLYSLQARMHL